MSAFDSMRTTALRKKQHVNFSDPDTGDIKLTYCPLGDGFADVKSILRADGLALICEVCGYIIE